MKILHIITNLETGGAEKLLVDSLPLYIDRGIEVNLLLINGKDTSFKKELITKGVQIHSLGTGSVYNPLHIFKIMPYLKRYDVFHVHLFPTLYWVAFAKVLAFSKKNLIFTEHNTYNNRLNKPIWRQVDRFIYKQYAKIISITKDVDQIIKGHLQYRDKNKFLVITNGIDLSRFNEIHNSKVDTDCKYIIQVSSFDKLRKDQSTLIKAMQYLADNVQLLLVGEGSDREDCEELVIQLNLSERVSFLGIRNDIPNLLSSSDIVVQSSIHEGFGLAALEGMAAGKPVIASDVPGLNTVVKDAGLLFPVGDEKDLAEKINLLLSDNKLYHDVSQRCLERSKKYDINLMVDRYTALYESLIKK